MLVMSCVCVFCDCHAVVRGGVLPLNQCLRVSAGNQTSWGWCGPGGTDACVPRWNHCADTNIHTHRSTHSITNALFVVQLHSWQPGIKNPYRGMVVWPVPENIDISVTLFKVPKQKNISEIFEKCFWMNLVCVVMFRSTLQIVHNEELWVTTNEFKAS